MLGSSDKTAEIINRGYGRDVFERAMEILEKYERDENLDRLAAFIFGEDNI